MNKEVIEAARGYAVDGLYEAALAKIGSLIRDNEGPPVALNLKGNILQLKANDTNLNLSKAEIDRLRDAAQECYERILRIDRNYARAYIDLGDLWGERGNHIVAIELFDKALDLLKAGIFVESIHDELEEAHRGKIAVLMQTKLLAELEMARADARKDLPDADWI